VSTNGTALNDTLWDRLTNLMAQTGATPSQILESFPKDNQRHDNTWRNWREKKTVMKISDLEYIAKALDVTAASLLTPTGSVPLQMELPFDTERRSVLIEIECRQSSLRIKGA
jgi:hypothetical protein